LHKVQGIVGVNHLLIVNGLATGEICVIAPAFDTHQFSIEAGGNILTTTGDDILLSSTDQIALLIGHPDGSGNVIATQLGGLPLPRFQDLADATGWLTETAEDRIHYNASASSWENYRNTYNATADPTTGDDSNDRYRIGSIIYNATDDKWFIAPSVAVGAAVWKQLGKIIGTLGSTDNAVPRADGTGGKTLQATGFTINDDDALNFPDTTNTSPVEGDLSRDGNALDFVNGIGTYDLTRHADGLPFTDPTTPTWTALNQGGGSYSEDTTNKRLTISEDGDGSLDIRGWHTPIPAGGAPYTVTLYIQSVVPLIAALGFLVGWRQSSVGKISALRAIFNGTLTAMVIRSDKFYSATALRANYPNSPVD
jgi:hypothetical protein